MSEKISQMTDVTPAQASDSVPVVRSSANGKVTADSIATLALKTTAANDPAQGTDVLTAIRSGVKVGISAASAASLGRPLLQTNSVDNSSQATLNLEAGSNITLTDGGGGAITIAAAGGGSGLVLTASVHLSSSDLTSLRSTPKTLVAGQGGKTIVPIFYQLIYNHVTTHYSGDTGNVFNVFPGTSITLSYDNGIRATGMVNVSASSIAFSNASAPNNQQAFPVPQALASFQGQDLSLGFGASQGASPLSGGDGTMDVVVAYMVI